MQAEGWGEEARVLVCAPYGRDADSLAELLRRRDHRVELHPDLRSLTQGPHEAAGAVLITEEALARGREDLQAWLERQPSWSDVPVVLLGRRKAGAYGVDDKTRTSRLSTNLVLLERPLGADSLISAVENALSGRRRQFETARLIADLRLSQAALEASENQLRTVADALPVLVAFVGRDMRYRFANRAYLDWFGVDPAEVVGRHVAEFATETLGADAYAQRKDSIRRVLDGEPVVLELPWPHADGSRRDAEVRYIPRRTTAGQVDGFDVFVQDITARVMVEEVLRGAAEALEVRVAERTAALETEMSRRAEAEATLRQAQKLEAVGQLTGGIAHDFNNMLTGVLGSLSIIDRRLKEGRFDDLGRFMDAATTSAERAAALTQRLLAFSRRQSLHTQPTEVGALIRGLSDLFDQALNENVRLVLDLDGVDPVAAVDPHQLENALLNLVINARDALPDGGAVTVGAALIETGDADVETLGRRHVVVRVADTGVGMPPEVVERVFEPFFTTKPVGQGTGLGLSMVYGFVQQSGGLVRIDSAPGRGTIISLHLPETDLAATGPVVLTAPEPPDGEGQKVLFVEDDPNVRLLVREVLGELGFDAIEAADPETALRVLSTEAAISLMITDVGLPGMNGRQLAEIARSGRPDLPILFVTGYAENAAMRAEFLGANMAMITKPFSMDVLSRRIQEALSPQ